MKLVGTISTPSSDAERYCHENSVLRLVLAVLGLVLGAFDQIALRARIRNRHPKRADAGRGRHGGSQSCPTARRSRGDLWQPRHVDPIPRDSIHPRRRLGRGLSDRHQRRFSLNGGVPFSVTSRTQGFAAPEIGVIQDLRPVGVPGAFGLGFAGLSGLGAEYRGRAPAGSFSMTSAANTWCLESTPRWASNSSDRLSVRRRADARQRLRATRLHRPVGQQCHGERLRVARHLWARLRAESLQHRWRVLSDPVGLHVSQRRPLRQHVPRPFRISTARPSGSAGPIAA